MPALMKKQIIGKSTEITLTLPTAKAAPVEAAIDAVLTAAGLKVRQMDSAGEELFSIEEVFPEAHPGTALRGLRTREGLTQASMAKKLQIPQSHLSDMERGARPVTVGMAKRLEEAFGIGYRAFL